MRTVAIALLLALLLACLCACEKPPGTSKTTPSSAPAGPGAPPASAPASSGDQLRLGGIAFTVPTGWVQVPPANSMRLAQLEVPDAGGDPSLACVAVFSSAGGSVEQNVTRWAGQVVDENGSPSPVQIDQRTAAGVSVSVVEFTGIYRGMGTGAPMADWTMRGAIFETQVGLLFLKMTGPSGAMRDTLPAFNEMLEQASAAG